MILFEECINLNAVGILGVCFVVLHVLGYMPIFPAVLGGLLIIVSTYSMYRFHNDISLIAFSLGYQTAMMMDEEEQ